MKSIGFHSQFDRYMNEYEVFQAIIQFGEAIQGPQILGMALYGV